LVSSTFVSGTLRLAQAKYSPVIVQSTVVDSDVIAAKRQKDYQLFRARFINCRFHGLFSGVDFGRTGRALLHEDFGGVEGCDFTEATLAGCRFFNVDMSTLRLPAWPHVVLHDFSKRAQDVAAMAWPGRVRAVHAHLRRPAPVGQSVSVSCALVREAGGMHRGASTRSLREIRWLAAVIRETTYAFRAK
jgi:hypothetical protein